MMKLTTRALDLLRDNYVPGDYGGLNFVNLIARGVEPSCEMDVEDLIEELVESDFSVQRAGTQDCVVRVYHDWRKTYYLSVNAAGRVTSVTRGAEPPGTAAATPRARG